MNTLEGIRMNQSNNGNNNNNSSNNQGNRPAGAGGQNAPRKGFHSGRRPQQNNPNGNRQQGPGNQQNTQGQSAAQGQGPRQPGQGQGQQRPAGQGGNPNQNQGQRRPHHGNRNPQHRHRHPNQNTHHNQPQAPRGNDAIFDRYEQLRNEHMAARKKYFEMFGTPDNNLKRKLEITFNKTVEALSNYENTLSPEQREALLKKIELYKFDLTYSENRELIKDPTIKPAFGLYPGLNETPPEAPFQDPHFLQTQSNRPSFKDDTEESVGSIEDYKKLKGL